MQNNTFYKMTLLPLPRSLGLDNIYIYIYFAVDQLALRSIPLEIEQKTLVSSLGIQPSQIWKKIIIIIRIRNLKK